MRPAAVPGRLGGAALLAVGVLAAGGCGSSSPAHTATSPGAAAKAPPAATTSTVAGAHIVTASSGSAVASMRVTTPTPRAGRPWPVRFTVTAAGRPAPASVGYEFLLAGQVVARRSHYTFNGNFSDIVVWPASAIGYPLTFRAVVVSGASTINLDYPVRVGR
jgi:hypothetical protein